MKAQELFNVKDQVVAITGAASGIGLAYAEVMVANGARVHLIDLNPQALDEAVERLKASGADVRGHVADVTRPETVRQAFDTIVSHRGRLDVVFANAGISGGPGFLTGAGVRNPAGALENLSLDVWEQVIATNVTSVLLTLQMVVPHMKKQSGGRIIVTSSIAASKTETLVSSIYATSKAAVAHLVRQAAHELAAYNILVNAIAPGPPEICRCSGTIRAGRAVAPHLHAFRPAGRCTVSGVTGILADDRCTNRHRRWHSARPCRLRPNTS